MYPEGTRVRTRYGKGRVMEPVELDPGAAYVWLDSGRLLIAPLDEVAPASWWRFLLWLIT